MKRGAAGFTLVEVMLATVLLAGGLALAFASVRSAIARPTAFASPCPSGPVVVSTPGV